MSRALVDLVVVTSLALVRQHARAAQVDRLAMCTCTCTRSIACAACSEWAEPTSNRELADENQVWRTQLPRKEWHTDDIYVIKQHLYRRLLYGD